MHHQNPNPQHPNQGFHIAGAGDERFRRMAAHNAKVIKRSRLARRTLRILILLCGPLGMLFILMGDRDSLLAPFGFFLLLVTMVCGAGLFILGGIAPSRVRPLLSDREQQRLDD